MIVWWFLTVVLGWITFPFSFWLFHRLPDRGYTVSRALGLLATSYLLWIGASLQILPNDLAGIALTILIICAFSAWLTLRTTGRTAELINFIQRNWRLILTSELLFALTFIGWSTLRAFAVGKIMEVGGEKFMEMAFLNGILHSAHFPPMDPWLSGYAISYYYFGYVMMNVLTQVSGALAGVAFELYDALLFSLTCLGAFGLVYNMVRANRFDRRGAISAGLLGAVLTAIMGNLQGLLEALYSRGWLPVNLANWLAIPDFPSHAQITGSLYAGSFWGWGWRASRVINDLDLAGRSMALNPITEFPNFSFLLGDNHPHVLGLPFALLAAAAGLHFLLSANSSQNIINVRVVFFAWIIGSLIFLNTWDFPIYLGLALLAWLVGKSAAAGRVTWPILWDTARLGITMLLCSTGFYAIFLLSFSSQAGGILPYTFPPTRLVQYLVMFGPFILILAGFLPASLYIQNRASAHPFTLKWLVSRWLRLSAGIFLLFAGLLLITSLVIWIDGLRGGHLALDLTPYFGSDNILVTLLQVLAQRAFNPWLSILLITLIFFSAAGIHLTIRSSAKPESDAHGFPTQAILPVESGLIFARLIGLIGLTLTFCVEFFYLRDGFGVRMNTVFKFYFQGWVLMACAAAYAIWWMINIKVKGFPRLVKTAYLASSLLIILAGMVYPLMGIYSRTEGFSTSPNLDGTSELRRQNPDDWAAIDWLTAHGQVGDHVPVLLEAPGTSYTYAGQISAFTGFPTLLGWASHELQWRGSYDVQAQREPVISEIYTTPDASTALQLLRGYAVDYVILGDTERSYIRAQCALPGKGCSPSSAEDKFNQTLTPVFQQGNTVVYAVPPS